MSRYRRRKIFLSRHRSKAIEPMRRCIGCMESKPKRELFRIVCSYGIPKRDRDGRAAGRGVYICKSVLCIENAKKRRALNRAFRQNFPQDVTEKIFEEIAEEIIDVER